MRGKQRVTNNIELKLPLESFHDLCALANGPADVTVRVKRGILSALLADNRLMLQAMLKAGIKLQAPPPKLRRQAFTE
jgi:hypothetical protein